MAAGPGSKPAPTAQSLHLRIWPEFAGDDATEAKLWRGSLSRMDGTGQRYFGTWEQLAAVLQELSGAGFPADSEDAPPAVARQRTLS